jgi:ABC-type cobalt transport system substrate-binding protein
MMINRSKIVAAVAALVCSYAFSAGATSMTYTGVGGNGKIVVDGIGSGSYTPIIVSLFVPQSWGNDNSQGNEQGSIQDLLKGIRFDIKTKTAFLSQIIGHPIIIKVVPPSVSPIPEPRTWALYGFGAVIAAWVIRKQLQRVSAS